MRRNKLVIVCIIAVSALSAVVASTAQASPLAYYACVKASPSKTGRYSNNECSNFVGSGGKYERESAAGATYTAKSKASVFSAPEMPVDGKVTCKKSTDAGKITGASVGEDQVTFSGCEAETGRCTSSGEPRGTIKTSVLNTELVGSESAPKVKFTASDRFQSVFDCEGVLIRTGGFTDGTYTDPPAGHANKKATEVFGDEENLTAEFSTDGGEEWVFEEFGGYDAEESVTVESTSSEEIGVD